MVERQTLDKPRGCCQFDGSTTTKKGLRVKAQLDEREYEIGKKVSDEDLSKVNIEPASFHGEWNYSIAPNTT